MRLKITGFLYPFSASALQLVSRGDGGRVQESFSKKLGGLSSDRNRPPYMVVAAKHR